MGDYTIIHYDTAELGYIYLDNKYISFKRGYVKHRDYYNKLAVICNNGRTLCPESYLSYSTAASYQITPGATLYVTPECRTPRDVFRNSGYKLTRDPKNANYTVFPAIQSRTCLDYNLLCKEKDSDILLVCTVRTPNNKRSYWELGDDDFDRIKAYFVGAGYNMEYYCDKIMPSEPKVYFIPKNQVYEDILNRVNNPLTYVEELEVPVIPQVQISKETLMLWKNTADDIFRKSVLVSDWKKYPVTMLAFVLCEKETAIQRVDPAFRLFLHAIGYDAYGGSSPLSFLSGKTVTPEDWNMLQDWITYNVGLPESGGHLSIQKMGSIQRYLPFIRSALTLAPLRISTETNLDNLVKLT